MPRAGLSCDLIIDEAVGQADQDGYEHLSLARIARHFDVAVPSLYKHVSGLDAVRRGVSIRAIDELGDAISEAALSDAADGTTRLQSVADAYRRYALAHPGRYAATVRAPAPGDTEHAAASDRILGTIFAMLAARGLAGSDAVDAARVLRAALHGFVTLETGGGFGMPVDVDRSFARLVAALDAGIGALGTAGPTTPAGLPGGS